MVVKRLAAILFSLLLIVAQSTVIATPVSSRPCAPKASCCGEDCQCHVDQPDGGSAAPVEATALPSSTHQFVLVPVAAGQMTPAAAANLPSFSLAGSRRPATLQPLFRLNCALLI
jgi:hypothetical protein